ncbi:D-2-hydroxyacid dehydrogenase [Picrophilus oshimae]|uniref:D-3-phosphoglycerate dehydrogenase n=1 Tax=Picrophilus torridus (strain ATCC 700027 / DSM 9790 / JCM 10055 / NBRC 100828 / KAW 2/3) TaxID=1122961 RepID=A0A8G2FWE3_PICTO|nr:D-2-hydroxyacid dehydrogenase [Picrophilus oshimae]SMD30741.1 D-3-phosphoglycerate dehydrogenase [Picrophilus oshimae DSM 9789]
MKGKILICDPVDGIMIEKLSKDFDIDNSPDITRDELLKKIGDYDIIIVRSRTKVDRDIIDNAKRLKIIARAGIGTDSIDVDYAQEKGIKIVYAPGSSTESVVELTVAFAVIAARQIIKGVENTRKNDFTKLKGIELSGKTLGIIGYGRIGRAIANAFSVFNVRSIAYDAYPVDFTGAEQVTLEDLLRNSDIISINITLRKDSPPVLNEKELSMLRDNAIVINTSRANAIEPRAFLKILKEKNIFYISDVFWHEPARFDYEFEMLKLPNVIITPHLGAQTREAQKRIAIMTADNILKEWS